MDKQTVMYSCNGILLNNTEWIINLCKIRWKMNFAKENSKSKKLHIALSDLMCYSGKDKILRKKTE